MNKKRTLSVSLLTVLLTILLLGTSTQIRADEDDDEYFHPPYSGMGPGMIGGGYGYGMGPGGGSYGRGFGMGPGMMGGSGGPLAGLELTAEQKEKIRNIQREQRRNHFATMEKMAEEQAQLSDLYAAEPLDAKKIGAAYGRIAKLRQGQIEANVNASNQVQAVLTKEQKDQLKAWRKDLGKRGYGPGYDPGMMRR